MLKRPHVPKVELPPTPAFEFKLVDVTRLECALDTGVTLSFDLEKGDSFKEDAKGLTIKLGKRTLRIREKRILFTETRPEKLKQQITPELIINAAVKQ